MGSGCSVSGSRRKRHHEQLTADKASGSVFNRDSRESTPNGVRVRSGTASDGESHSDDVDMELGLQDKRNQDRRDESLQSSKTSNSMDQQQITREAESVLNDLLKEGNRQFGEGFGLEDDGNDSSNSMRGIDLLLQAARDMDSAPAP